MKLCTPLYVSLNMRRINSRASTLIFTRFSGGGFRSNLVGRSDSIWKDRENEPIFPPVERSSGELFPVSSGGERDGTERLSAGRPWIGGVAPSVTGLWPTALALRSCARITVPPPTLLSHSPSFSTRVSISFRTSSGFLLPPEMQEMRRIVRRIERGLKIIRDRCVISSLLFVSSKQGWGGGIGGLNY